MLTSRGPSLCARTAIQPRSRPSCENRSGRGLQSGHLQRGHAAGPAVQRRVAAAAVRCAGGDVCCHGGRPRCRRHLWRSELFSRRTPPRDRHSDGARRASFRGSRSRSWSDRSADAHWHCSRSWRRGGSDAVLDWMLFGLAPLDPTTFGVAALLFAAIATIATLVPARRATRVDPAHCPSLKDTSARRAAEARGFPPASERPILTATLRGPCARAGRSSSASPRLRGLASRT